MRHHRSLAPRASLGFALAALGACADLPAPPASDAATPADRAAPRADAAALRADSSPTPPPASPDAANTLDDAASPASPDAAAAMGSGGSGGAPGESPGPCPDCRIYAPPGYSPATPAPLLVALHGDEGRDIGRAAATSGVIASWRAAADAHGFVVLALACPASEGCNGAWSDWLAATGYRVPDTAIAWAGRQVDAVERMYNVARAREYLAGYSGGAYWLGYYAPAAAARFAGAAFVAGGMPAWRAYNACPACAIPGYFLAGDHDFRTRQISDTANAFEGCGSTVVRDLFAGDHEQTIASLTSAGRADAILRWFDAHPLGCR